MFRAHTSRCFCVISALIILVAISTYASGADWELPRATDVTATDTLVECVSTDGCAVSVACTSGPPASGFEDSDFAAVHGSPIGNGEALLTPLVTDDKERCVLRVAGDANITGFRYMRMRTEHESFHFSGVTEVPIHRVRSASQVIIPVRLARNLLDVYFAHPLVEFDSANALIHGLCEHIREGHIERTYCEDTVKSGLRRLEYTLADAYSSCLMNGFIEAGDYEDGAYMLWSAYDYVVENRMYETYTCEHDPDSCYGCVDAKLTRQ